MHTNDVININTFLLIGTLLTGVAIIWVQVRRGASDAAADSNVILRGLIRDQKFEIDKLRERQQVLSTEIQSLRLEVGESARIVSTSSSSSPWP